MVATAGGSALVLAVSSISFVGLGLIAAILPVMSPERGAEATNILQGVLLLISGVYYPVSVLPNWLQPLCLAVAGNIFIERFPAAPGTGRGRTRSFQRVLFRTFCGCCC